MAEFEVETDELWGIYEWECQGCDLFGRVNDLLLCQECAVKLERDLIRQRDWAYSAIANGLSSEEQEELHRRVIKQYGETLEFIAPSKRPGNDTARRKRRRQGKKKEG